MKVGAKGGGRCIGGSHYEYCSHGEDVALGVDYGAIQREKKTTYPAMIQRETPAFTETHDHLDHCGGVPAFLREHPETVPYMTLMALRGTMLQMRDTLKISRSRAEVDTLRGRKPTPAPFSEEDVQNFFKRARQKTVLNSDWFSPMPGYRMSFRSAGHKPGAAMLLIVFPDGTRWIHACDFSIEESELVLGAKVPDDFKNPDGMTIECTYGSRDEDRQPPDRKQELVRLYQEVTRVFDRSGKLLVPHFASTLQNIAFQLARWGFRTYIDGMGRDFSYLYELTSPWCENDKPFRFDDLDLKDTLSPVGKMGNDREERQSLVERPGPFSIVTSSGMMVGGPSVFYAERFLEDSRNAIILPGYQAPGTMGRMLAELERGRSITFEHEPMAYTKYGKRLLREGWSETHQILCDVLPFRLSGHSGRKMVAEWVCQINPKKVVEVHGDPEAHEGMKWQIQQLNPAIEVFSLGNDEEFDFGAP
ncbi:MAG TPA: MBL fold metallo-hydrolase [Candidatus Paceibacterota bacterium]